MGGVWRSFFFRFPVFRLPASLLFWPSCRVLLGGGPCLTVQNPFFLVFTVFLRFFHTFPPVAGQLCCRFFLVRLVFFFPPAGLFCVWRCGPPNLVLLVGEGVLLGKKSYRWTRMGCFFALFAPMFFSCSPSPFWAACEYNSALGDPFFVSFERCFLNANVWRALHAQGCLWDVLSTPPPAFLLGAECPFY